MRLVKFIPFNGGNVEKLNLDDLICVWKQYSKTSKARCHGPVCNGKTIDSGALRYGRITKGPYGESVQWRHW